MINYNFLAAKNYYKKLGKESRDKQLIILIWKLCKAVAQKAYKDIPDIIGKISNNEKYKPVANAAASWHNNRMWNYVENGYESISLENIGKLGIVTSSLPEELKARDYVVTEEFVYPRRKIPEKPPIDAGIEIKAIAETMRALESL